LIRLSLCLSTDLIHLHRLTAATATCGIIARLRDCEISPKTGKNNTTVKTVRAAPPRPAHGQAGPTTWGLGFFLKERHHENLHLAEMAL
jgi:hypothetical protein